MTIKHIGIFDSGHGGLEILQYLASRHPLWQFKYTADLDFMPYGDKEFDVIIKRCTEITEELIRQGCCAIIVACNTATAIAIDHLREVFDIPIIGIEPYLNYINKAPTKDFQQGHLGALVTPNTFQSSRFKELKKAKDPHDLVKVETIFELAPLVEELIAKKDLKSFKSELSRLLKGVAAHGWKEVILGCTHYPLIGEFIATELSVVCISPTRSVAAQLENRLGVASKGYPSDEAPQYNCRFDYLDTRVGERRTVEMSDFLFWRY